MGLWARTQQWFRRLTGKPSRPGRWLDGHAFSWRGLMGFRPWVFPRRRYRLYVPTGWTTVRADRLDDGARRQAGRRCAPRHWSS